MPRKLRFAPPNYPLHVTQRGNYRQQVFFCDADRDHFLALLDHHADLRQVMVHSHSLMSNHFHLVLTGQVQDGVSRFRQHLTGQYAQYLHGRLNRRGRLWQSRFYSCVLDPHHFLTALAYVDLNPVRARMVDRAEDYAWSSASAHSGPQAAPEWLHLAALHGHVTPSEWRERLRQPQSRGDLAALRRATQTEIPLGQPGFVEDPTSAYGRFRWAGRRGRWCKARRTPLRSPVVPGSQREGAGRSVSGEIGVCTPGTPLTPISIKASRRTGQAA